MSVRNPELIVIVGGGVSAQRCALALRQLGFERAVEIVGGEREPPYDRTLLSKELLASEELADSVPLCSANEYAAAEIHVRLGVRATKLDIAASQLRLSDGATLDYDRLVLATGGRAHIPLALACPGVLTLREIADVPRLHDALSRVHHLAVVGAGFIGCEVASAAVARNVPVTLIEGTHGPLSAVLGDEVADRLAELHRAAGVDVRCGTPVHAIRRERDGYSLAFADGGQLRADAVLIGTGMAPDVEWLSGSGVKLDDGILTDAACRTNVPDVFAAGDCARWEHPHYGQALRVGHWDVARRHGEAAAATTLGSDEPFAPVPYFWSDQHGTKLQWVGHAPTWDEIEIDNGGEPPTLVARYRSAGEMVGTFTIGQPHASAAARRELEQAFAQRAKVGAPA